MQPYGDLGLPDRRAATVTSAFTARLDLMQRRCS